MSVLYHLVYGGHARFYNSSQGFLLQCGDAAGDIPRRWVSASHILTQGLGAILNSLDEFDYLLGDALIGGSFRQQMLCAYHLRGLSEDNRPACLYHEVAGVS